MGKENDVSQEGAVKGGTRMPVTACSRHGPMGGSAKIPRLRMRCTMPVGPSKRTSTVTDVWLSMPSTQSATRR